MTTGTDVGPVETDAGIHTDTCDPPRTRGRTRIRMRAVGYCALLALPLVLAVAAGVLMYMAWNQAEIASARTESAQAASASAVAMLSYHPDTVQNDLDAAKDRMTGSFRDSYSSLVDDVVAPAAIRKTISAAATVSAMAPVSASRDHAVVLLFVNQNITVGSEPPSSTNSCVRVTLDRVGGRWLVAGFDPV